MITQQEIRKILHYNPDTGIFSWLVDRTANKMLGKQAGTLHPSGYVHIQINRKSYSAHALAWLYMEGYFPENQIDHKNRIRNDNIWSNLRESTNACNAKNRKVRTDSISGITGVSPYKGMWKVQISNSGKDVNLGCFETKLEGAKVRYAAEVKYNYPDCQLNSSAKHYIDSSSPALAYVKES